MTTAGQAADDDIEDRNNAVDNGSEDGADAVNNSHEDSANGLAYALELVVGQ